MPDRQQRRCIVVTCFGDIRSSVLEANGIVSLPQPSLARKRGQTQVRRRLPVRWYSTTAARWLVLASSVLFSTGGATIKTGAFSAAQVSAFRSGIAAIVLSIYLVAVRGGRLSLALLPAGVLYGHTDLVCGRQQAHHRGQRHLSPGGRAALHPSSRPIGAGRALDVARPGPRGRARGGSGAVLCRPGDAHRIGARSGNRESAGCAVQRRLGQHAPVPAPFRQVRGRRHRGPGRGHRRQRDCSRSGDPLRLAAAQRAGGGVGDAGLPGRVPDRAGLRVLHPRHPACRRSRHRCSS